MKIKFSIFTLHSIYSVDPKKQFAITMSKCLYYPTYKNMEVKHFILHFPINKTETIHYNNKEAAWPNKKKMFRRSIECAALP